MPTHSSTVTSRRPSFPLTGSEAVSHDSDLLQRCLVLLHHAVHGLLGGLEALHGLLSVQLLEPCVAHQLLV